ncbi:hypothetical protein FUT28_13380 [Enterococcus durans]|uniref:hypothetical protein n=1 Tax=Enterococcus TaxID=1350 RepID=UPI0010C1DF0D|nr:MULTISPECIES: hypothetical protein [Enterococcus]NJE65254.1 hypothetical protein [Enterococcus durans]QED60698.1 hypothetical protein FS851_13340 [Enterococcus durans]QED63301.1 hypothetical protein FUT28_13380 [Enterococcus durans]TKN14701.1 hypothetical protein DVW83_13575 [Enterococcus sp. VV15]
MDFQQAKRKKERGQTNEEFLKWVFEEVKDFEQISITVEYPSGSIETFFSQEESLSLVGMLEVGKQQILTDMQY